MTMNRSNTINSLDNDRLVDKNEVLASAVEKIEAMSENDLPDGLSREAMIEAIRAAIFGE